MSACSGGGDDDTPDANGTTEAPPSTSSTLPPSSTTVALIAPTETTGARTALRAADGSALWSVASPNAYPTRPVTSDGVVFVRATDPCDEGAATVIAVDPLDGRELWRLAEPQLPPFFPSINAAVSDDIFVAGSGGRVRALDARTGAVRWERETDVDGGAIAGHGLAVVVGGGAEAAQTGIRLEAFDLATGAPRWQATAPTGLLVGAFATAHGFVAEIRGPTSVDGVPVMPHLTIVQLDPATGAQRWLLDAGTAEAVGTPSPGTDVLSFGILALTSPATVDPATGAVRYLDARNGVIVVDDATGVERWRRIAQPDPANALAGALELVGSGNGPHTADVVFVMAGLGDLLALDAASGAERWRRTDLPVHPRAIGAVGDLVVLPGIPPVVVDGEIGSPGTPTIAVHGEDGTDAWTATDAYGMAGGDSSVVLLAAGPTGSCLD
jgi:outer membrane protein assembly factor BamB